MSEVAVTITRPPKVALTLVSGAGHTLNLSSESSLAVSLSGEGAVDLTVETPPTRSVALTPPTEELVLQLANVLRGPPGVPGADGQDGQDGVDGDVHYEHNQGVASDTWVINHSLGKRPSVTVIDSAGDECQGDVTYPSADQVVVYFSAPFSGKAYLN
jgi:hypothetical protein